MMVRMTMSAWCAVIFLYAVPANAQSPDAPASDAEYSAVDSQSPDFVRCKRLDVTGSRARKERVCKTNAEWDRVARVGAELGRDTVERSTSFYQDPSTRGPGGGL